MKRVSGATNAASAARRRWSRRDFLKLGGAGLAGAALLGGAACGPAAEPGNGPTRIVFSFGPDESGTLQEVVDRFNQQYEGEIEVEYREMSEITDEYFRSMVSDFQAGGGDIDVIGGDVVWAAEFAANGWIEDPGRRMYTDYEPRVPDAFLRAPLDTVAFRNSLWGVPWFTDTGLLFYRRDLLEESGFDAAPTTWDGLREIANQTMEDAGTRYGFVFQGDDYEGGVANGCEFVWNAGGNILTLNISVIESDRPRSVDPNVVVIDSPASVRGLEIARGLITDGVSPEEVVTFREQETYEAFLGGDAVFMRGWPFMYALAEGEDFPVSPDQIGVAPLPVADEGMQSFSCLGGWNMYINSASQNQDAAWEFVKFATSPEQQRFRAMEGSFLPTLSEIYEDQEVLEQAPAIRLGRDIVVENSRPRPVTQFYSQISTRLARGFNRAFSGEVGPEEAVQGMQEELEAIIRQN